MPNSIAVTFQSCFSLLEKEVNIFFIRDYINKDLFMASLSLILEEIATEHFQSYIQSKLTRHNLDYTVQQLARVGHSSGAFMLGQGRQFIYIPLKLQLQLDLSDHVNELTFCSVLLLLFVQQHTVHSILMTRLLLTIYAAKSVLLKLGV